jgi:2-polyprenyl-6-methoxyphenol hydroxylase-like FAD-dependent oxidoreductase
VANIERALVVGAGIGGLGAAAMLGQQGTKVDVVEVKDDATVFGVGINQPANSLRALKEIGVLPEILEVGVVFDGWTFRDYRDRIVADIVNRLGGDDVPPNCALPRRSLHKILIAAAEHAGAEVRYGTTVQDLQDKGASVEVAFDDGSGGTYDLVVAFDGIGSPMRKRLFGQAYEPVYSGHVVWRVTVPRQAEATKGAVFQSPRSKGGYIPLTEDTMYLFLVTHEPAGVHRPKEEFADLLRERLSEYEGALGVIRENLNDDDDIVYSPLREVFLPPPWHRGRVVMGGDAAHACAPHITQGAAMALEDAVVLGQELALTTEVDAALDAYEDRRYPRARFVQDVSRGILDAEMATNEENLAATIAGMEAHLPEQMAQVDEFLNQPA